MLGYIGVYCHFQQYFSYIVAVSIIGQVEVPKKTIDKSHTPRHERKSLVVIYTDCIGRCKSNYHMIVATTAILFSVNMSDRFDLVWVQVGING